MKLNEIVKEMRADGVFEDKEVTFITDNSAKVCDGCIFVCIEGRRFQ